jgi:superfamily I DNA/RNA helicase
MNWSEQQQTIFSWFQSPPAMGNLVVRARAGTGKTTTIVEAVKYIQSGQRVLVCAFNKRIALELQKKLAGTQADALTLHSLGYKFLRGAWGDLTVDSAVEDDRIEQACQMIDGETAPWDVMGGLKKLVAIAKGAMPDVKDESAGDPLLRLTELCTAFACDTDSDFYGATWMAKIALRALELALTPDTIGRISFDDMLFIPAALGFAIPLYDWVIVDEAQDMNLAQLKIARQACKADGHIVVVGDDRQAIYGFRGADSDAVDRLKNELQAQELGLTTTYRCPKKVVALAQSIVPDFDHPEWADDGEVEEIRFEDVQETAEAGDVVLSRVNAPLVPLCLSFIRQGKGARIEGRDIGKLLVARAKKLKATTVEDFLAKLTKWANTASSRIIARGKAVDSRLQQIRDVEATLEALAENAASVQMIYDRCEKLFADVAENGASNLIVLSTVHKAKGLEWRRVFVLDDTFYMFGREREECNIEYVALTRTKSHLFRVKGVHAAA